MNKIWLLMYNREKHFQFFKYFDTEYEKDKYKRRVKYIKELMIIEDSTDMNWNYS